MHRVDCICAELPRLAHVLPVVVYVHAHEVFRPSNTGSLLPRVLEGARLVVHGSGERQAWSDAALSPAMVLHPDGRELVAEDAERFSALLVPDGSWSQARRMVHRLPALRAGTFVRLPAPSAPPCADAALTLRRRPRREHVSTYEAVARALGILESHELEEQMLSVLRAVVARARFRRRFPHAHALLRDWVT
jgi:DTW domain-containing protein YfiP